MAFCFLCGQSKAANVNIRIFRVPADDERREKWMDAVGKFLPPSSFVCSTHFSRETLGRKKLLKNATPFYFVESANRSCEKKKMTNITPEIASQENFALKNREDGDSYDRTHNLEDRLSLSPSSSITLTSSETEFEMKKQELQESAPHHSSCNTSNIEYINLTFSSSSTASRNESSQKEELLERTTLNDYRKARMTKSCYVATCSNTYEKTKNLCVIDEKSCTLTVITYHSFPRHPHLRKKWVQATGRTNWEPNNRTFICSEHFRESDYETLKSVQPEDDDNPTQLKRVLKQNAIPTLQLGKRAKNSQKSSWPNCRSTDISSGINEKFKSLINRNENMFLSDQNIDLSIVKDEPNSCEEFDNSSNRLPFVITSANTVNEENNFGEEQNGHLESSVEFLNRHNMERDHSPEFFWPKRQKHQDSLIAPEDIKVERCSSPLSEDPSLPIEERYEHLLSKFMKLKRDYDILKYKFDRQSDAITKCEHILSECR